MALKRVWTPTNNYSNGGTKTLLVIHSMEGFTGPNGAKDCAIYFQGNSGASSQVCIDNNRGTIWEGVARQYGAWTQCNYNSRSISCEQSGYASWSKDYWLTNRSNQLHNIADWLAEESAKTGIPLVKISDPNGRGVIYHSNLGSTGCGHSDPGSGWPINEVLAWAKGGSTPAPIEEDTDMQIGTAYDSQGRAHFVKVQSHMLYYKGPGNPGSGWYNVDPGANVKEGASIAVDNANDDTLLIAYTNDASHPCSYEKPMVGGPWHWVDRN